jgi:uncharacterized protein (TIGR01777 family)
MNLYADMLRVLIAGGTGFIGQALTQHFLTIGYEVAILGRSKKKIINLYGDRVIPLSWKDFEVDKVSTSNREQSVGAKQRGSDLLSTFDLVINLTGANIAQKRWTSKRKEEILKSRIEPTQILAAICAQLGEKAPTLFNASAVGIYGLQKPVMPQLPLPFNEDQPLDFNASPDFLSQVGQSWEKATHEAAAKGVRVVNMRFAVVLGPNGLLKKLITPYQLGLGGKLGSGYQPFSWVALEDLIAAIDFLVAHPTIKGPVNIVSPQCLTQAQFAKALAKALHRPAVLKTPAFLLKLVLGEMADELLLNGQCAYPKVLLTHGFTFKYPNINTTLMHNIANHE